MDASDVGSLIAVGVTAIATAGLFTFAVVQWRILQRSIEEGSKARFAAVLLEIYKIMRELRPQWHELYALPDDFHTWNDEQRTLADRVVAQLQNVSYLCLKGLIDSDYVMDNWAKTFVRCWDKLELFIRDYRVECGEPAEVEKGAFQRKDLELFARQCRAFEQEKYGQAAQRHKRLEAGDRRRAWFKGGLYVGLAGLAISSVTSVLLGALVLGWIVFSPPVWVGVQVGIIFAWICLVAGIVLVVRGIKRE